jgi:hypothetical protein
MTTVDATDIVGAVDATESPPQTQPLSDDNPYRFVTLEEYCSLPADPQKWIVKKLIPVGGMVNLYAKPKLGKALALNTELFTPDGWKTIADIQVGDCVFGSDGKPVEVIGTYSWTQRPIMRVTFDDGTHVDCDKEHEWTVNQHRPIGPSVTLSTSELWEKGITVKDGPYERPKYSVSLVESLEFPEQDLSLDPYLLGVWLGDGTSSTGAITSADREIVDAWTNSGWTVKKWKAPYAYGVKGLRMLLKDMQLLNNKHIPLEYMIASKQQRLQLLRGLMDTDGYALGGESAEFYNTNQVLAHQVLELANGLGFKAHMREKKATLYGKDCGTVYTVCVRAHEQIFNLKRKADKFKLNINERYRMITNIQCHPQQQTTKCLSVDAEDGLFVVGQNNVLTHNSYMMLSIIESMLDGKSTWEGFEICKYGPIAYLQIDTPREEWMSRAKAMLQRLKNKNAAEMFWMADMWNIPQFPFNIVNPDNTELMWLKNELDKIKPILVVIDTLREVHSGDENDNSVMRNVVARLIQACRGEVGSPTAIVLISHQRKDGLAAIEGHDDMMDQNRGASYIAGKMDTILRLTKKRLTYKGRAIGQEFVEIEQDPHTHLIKVVGHKQEGVEDDEWTKDIVAISDQHPGISKNDLGKRLAAKHGVSQSTAIRRIDEWASKVAKH